MSPGWDETPISWTYCRKIGKPWGLQAQSYLPNTINGLGAAVRPSCISHL